MFTYEEWLEDLEAVPENQRLEFIRLSLAPKHMLHIFGRYYFPSEIPEGQDTPEFHLELDEWLGKPESCAIIEPRGHAKTTWSRIDIIHDIVYGHEPFIVFVGPTMTDAQASLAYVKAQLEINDLLRHVYGELVPGIEAQKRQKWSDSHIETTNDVIVLARGAGKGRGLNIKGRRPTKVLLDDMEEDEHIQSEAYRKKLENWLLRVIVPSLDPVTGKFKMIGTVLHYDCLILKVLAKYGGIRRAALETDGKPALDGSPIWPERFTAEKLQELKEDIGTFGFAQEYMNDPMSDENADVKLAWIKRVESVDLVDAQDRMLYKVYSALDPAISTKETADEAAICTVGKRIKKDKEEPLEIIVLSCEHGQWGSTGTIQKSQRVWKRYPHEKFGVETVAFQEVMRELLNNNGVPARPITRKSKDKRSRLGAIIGLIEFGKVKFGPNTDDLITQLVQFPNADHDDMVDAFVDAVTMAKGGGGGVHFSTL